MTTTNDTHGATIIVPDTENAPGDLDDLDFDWSNEDRVVEPITKMARLRWFNTHGNVTGTRTFNQNSCVAREKMSMKSDEEHPNEHQSI